MYRTYLLIFVGVFGLISVLFLIVATFTLEHAMNADFLPKAG